MISCHASPVALLRKITAQTCMWAECKHCLSRGGAVNSFYIWIMGEGVTWRGGSRLGKRSGSCCDDLLPFPRSALCFQTPAATGERMAESESPNQNHCTTTVTINYCSKDTRCQTHTFWDSFNSLCLSVLIWIDTWYHILPSNRVSKLNKSV